jgi:hypothetical protein
VSSIGDNETEDALELDPGETITCTFTNTKREQIIVDKVTVPAGDTQLFTFDPSWSETNFQLADATTPYNSGDLVPGAYSVSETVPAGWDLTDVSCVSSIGDNETEDDLELDPGETITCTFTNTKLGSIIVEKQTLPDNDLTEFTFTGAAAGVISDGEQIVVSDLLPGQYLSTETVPEGWDLTSIVCDDANSTGNVEMGVATFNLEAGETVKCTFTNTKGGQIIIDKVTVPAEDPQLFTFTPSWDAPFQLADLTTPYSSGALEPGSYSVSETVPAGWDLTDVSCVSSIGDNETEDALEFDPGETITCTFTNTKLYTISGTVTIYDYDLETFVGFEGVTITYGTELTNTTDEDGEYSFIVEHGWEGTIIPSMTGYIFKPINSVFGPVESNLTRDFTAYIDLIDVSITGTAIYGNTLTANVSPSEATVDYQWFVSIDDIEYLPISGAIKSTFIIPSDYVGKYIKVVATGTGVYDSEETSNPVQVSARPITVTADPQTKVYGAEEPDLSYQVTGSLVGEDAFTGALTRETGEDVGAYEILQGDLALDSNYALTYISDYLTITALELTVTADAKSKIYGQIDPAFTYTVIGELVEGDSFSGNLARVSGENVGTYAILQGTLTAGSNYTITYNTALFTILVRPIEVTADTKSKVYGDADPGLTYRITDGTLATGDAFTGSLTRVAGEKVGSYAIEQGSLALSTNYDLTYVPANLTITAKPIMVTANPQTKVYGDADPTFTYIYTPDGLEFDDTFDGALGRAPGEDVGIYAINIGGLVIVDGNNGDNYNLTFVSANLTITAKQITVTANPQTKFYGDVDPAFTYTYTQDGLEFDDSFDGALGRAPGEDVGTYAINIGGLVIVDGNNGDNYNLTFMSANLTITPKPITVTADAKTKTYGFQDPPLTYQVTEGGLVEGDSFSGGLARVSGEDVGSYTITRGTLTAGSNYTITFVTAELTIDVRQIEVTAVAKSKIYGDSDPALTYTISNGSLAYADTFSGELEREEGEIVDIYEIQQGTLSLSTNYALTYVPANFTITQRPITVTADNRSKTIGEDDPPLTYTWDGDLVFGETFSGELEREPGQDVGTYAILQGTLSLNTNYNLTYVEGVFTISPLPIVTVTADTQTKIYGEDDPTLTYTYSPDDPPILFTGSLSRVAGETVGTYQITKDDLAAEGYEIDFKSANLTITTRPIEVTADPQTKIYGDADPELTYAITDGTKLETDDFSGALDRAASENVGTYAIDQGTLTLGSNYEITFVSANLVITARQVTVEADPQTKIYGDADPDLTYQMTAGELIGEDDFTGELDRAVGEDVSTYAINKGSLTLGGNYAITYVIADLTITERSITVTANTQEKVYGEDDPDFTYGITSGSLAFTDVFTGVLDRALGEDVGDYDILKGTLAIDDGNAGDNYALTFMPGTLTITSSPITVTADPQTKVYGESDPEFTYAITSGSLVFTDDFTGELSRDPGEDVGAYAITKGTLALSTNYTLTLVSADLTITARPITITADDAWKIVGDVDPGFTYQIASGSLVDTDELTGVLDREGGETVGTYAIQQGMLTVDDGNNGDNYNLSFIEGSFEIVAELAQDCLTIDVTKLKQSLNPDSTAGLSFYLTNTCTYDVGFEILERETLVRQDFEEGIMPPTGWMTKVGTTDENGLFEWSLKDTLLEPDRVDEGRFAAWAGYSATNYKDEWLLSPAFDPGDLDDLSLTFRAFSSTVYYDDGTMQIWVTDADGNPITDYSEEPIWDMIEDEIWEGAVHRTVFLDLSDFAGYSEPIRIAWRYVGVNVNSFGLDMIDISASSEVNWLSSDPGWGTVGADETINVDVIFDSTGLSAGEYFGTIKASPLAPIPVTLLVFDDTNQLYLPLIVR